MSCRYKLKQIALAKRKSEVDLSSASYIRCLCYHGDTFLDMLTCHIAWPSEITRGAFLLLPKMVRPEAQLGLL